MTTIAANLEGMAADSFLSDGNAVCKIIELPNMLIGYSGEVFYAQMLADWIKDGERGLCPPWDENFSDKDDRAADTALLILNSSGLFLMDGRGKKVRVARNYAAIGSGADIALGALYHNHTPQQAVEAACAHDSATKPPVVYVELPRGKRKKGKV